MCLESLVAIMAIIAACTLHPGVYLGMNIKGDAAATVAKINAYGERYQVTAEEMDSLAKEVGEKTLFGRTGGAATLAVGMANIFSQTTKGRWLDLWYHFAIMFEALFILTTLDAGTRVGRYILQDFLGNLHKPLGNTQSLGANLLASGLIVCGWGYFLIQGVRDPLGGINSLWPLFGIANQMLAAIALCLTTTIILKMALQHSASVAPANKSGDSESETCGTPVLPSPALALVTLVPLLWLLSVTFTAGVQKIWHPDPRIGFLAQAETLRQKTPRLEAQMIAAEISADPDTIKLAEKAGRENRTQIFNNVLDACVAAAFLSLVAIIFLMSVREWILLLARKKVAELRESPPVWLPDYAIAEAKPLHAASVITLGFALAKELSGEAQLERAQKAAQICECSHQENKRDETAQSAPKTAEQVYLEVTEQRFKGVRRCC
jgi:carbon starvation protein